MLVVSCQLSDNKNFKRSFTPLEIQNKTNNLRSPKGDLSLTGFTFVELMIAVVILVVGLVLIIQGFITTAGALNTTQNYLAAMQFLDSKMQELEANAKKDNGIERTSDEGEFSSGARNFVWTQEIVAVQKSEDLDLSEDLNEVKLKVSWQERNYPKDLGVVTYLRNKKE